MFELIALGVVLLILFGIYRLLSELIDASKAKKNKDAPTPQQVPVSKPKEPESVAPSAKRIIEPASSCPSCGGHLTGTSDNCPYCNAAIPQNILYNKELMLELKEKEMALRAKELEHQTKEKELDIQNEQNKRKQRFRPAYFLFGLSGFFFFMLFIMYLIEK